MFDWLRKRMGRNDDIEDIRSNVLGQSSFDDDLPKFNRGNKFDPDLDDPMKKLSDERFDEPPAQRFGEPPGFNSIDTRAPQRAAAPQRSENSYDILDRLNLIESQLSAIRSQTETINERLKNMEAKLSLRRY